MQRECRSTRQLSACAGQKISNWIL